MHRDAKLKKRGGEESSNLYTSSALQHQTHVWWGWRSQTWHPGSWATHIARARREPWPPNPSVFWTPLWKPSRVEILQAEWGCARWKRSCRTCLSSLWRTAGTVPRWPFQRLRSSSTTTYLLDFWPRRSARTRRWRVGARSAQDLKRSDESPSIWMQLAGSYV